MVCIQNRNVASLAADSKVNRNVRAMTATEQNQQCRNTTFPAMTDNYNDPSSSSSSSPSTPEDETIDFDLLGLFPLPHSTSCNNNASHISQTYPGQSSPALSSGYCGHPTTPRTPYYDSIPQKPADQLPFAMRLDALPTLPCLSQQSDSESLTFLMCFLELTARSQNRSTTTLLHLDDVQDDDMSGMEGRVDKERAERQARARAANIARASSKIWTRQELGCGPFDTAIPLQHVRGFDDPTKETSFLLGWGEKGEEGYKKDVKPQFTNPWDGNKVIPLPPSEEDIEEECDDGWRTGSSVGSFSSYRHRFSSPFDSIGEFPSPGCPGRSPKSRRIYNNRCREYSSDSVETQMSDLGMEARYST